MHCFEQLESALRVNYVTIYEQDSARMAAADYEPRVCAVNEEFAVLSKARTHTGYKVNMMCKINDIRKHTEKKQLHALLVPEWRNDDVTAAGATAESDEELPWADECLNEEDTETSAQSTVTSLPNVEETACMNNNCDSDQSVKTDKESRSNHAEAPHAINDDVTPTKSRGADKIILPPQVPKIKYFFEKDADELQREIEAQQRQAAAEAAAMKCATGTTATPSKRDSLKEEKDAKDARSSSRSCSVANPLKLLDFNIKQEKDPIKLSSSTSAVLSQSHSQLSIKREALDTQHSDYASTDSLQIPVVKQETHRLPDDPCSNTPLEEHRLPDDPCSNTPLEEHLQYEIERLKCKLQLEEARLVRKRSRSSTVRCLLLQ